MHVTQLQKRIVALDSSQALTNGINKIKMKSNKSIKQILSKIAKHKKLCRTGLKYENDKST